MRRRGFLAAALAALPGTAAAQAGIVQRRRLRFVLTFANPLARELTDQKFWCYLPAHLEPRQALAGVAVSEPHDIDTDILGHRILVLAFARFPGYGRKVVTMDAEVTLRPGVERGTPGAPDELALRAAWLGPERYIEADAAEIRSLAAQLRGANELESTRNIYDWVRNSLNYAGYMADEFGALHALRYRRGDCTEYADLVVALARANGIPARTAGGYVTVRDATPRPQDYHNWAEVYLSGAWRIVDAQKENWLGSSQEYLVFRIHTTAVRNPLGSAHRFRMQGSLQVWL
jgi:hemolysin-activating ACP:hemolysin acyltransferase